MLLAAKIFDLPGCVSSSIPKFKPSVPEIAAAAEGVEPIFQNEFQRV